MFSSISQKFNHCVPFIASVVFTTTYTIPIQAQIKTPKNFQLPNTETITKFQKQQFTPEFGAQIAVFEGHEDDITSAVFSPDGSHILTTGNDKTVRLWNVSDAINAQSQQLAIDSLLATFQRQMNVIESLNNQIASKKLQRSYFISNQNYYQFYIDLLMELHQQNPHKGYDALALEASERARTSSLLKLLTEGRYKIHQGVEPQLLEQQRILHEKLNLLALQKYQIRYRKERKEIYQQVEYIIAELDKIESKIRITSPHYINLTLPKPLTIKEIQQQVLDQDTLLLEYYLGKKKSYLWVVAKNQIYSYELGKNAKEIEELAKQFHTKIQSPLRYNKFVSWRKLSNKLTNILLLPVAEKLGNKRLLIVGDGALQYLPFAALSTPNYHKYQPLIVHHEIITLPSASTVALLRSEQKDRKPAPKTIAILADPVFIKDDERFLEQAKPSKEHPHNKYIEFFRIPYTRVEAEAILKLIPRNKTLKAYDFDANRDFFKNYQLNQYQILHFATYSIADTEQPELSGLVLSLFNEKGEPENGFFGLHDIFKLNLSADLVVLSSCDAGLGADIKGEGMVGLPTAFLYAGSSRIIMSLFSVHDEATSVLMEKFYQKMFKEGLKPAAALRKAQIEMFNGEKFSQPYYWSAFTLQGEWQ